MKRVVVMLLLLTFAQIGRAGQPTDARQTLAKWGFVYCLHTYSKDESIKHQAGLSRGGYFQLGSHDDPAAYDNVMRYIKQKYPLFSGGSQKTNEEMTIAGCLDLYASPGYSKLIKKQDKFVGK